MAKTIDGLTEREIELLSWAAEGMTAEEISEQMGVTVNTTKTRKSRIFGKLRVSNTAEAVFKTVHEIAEWRRNHGIPDPSIGQSPWLGG